MFTNSHYTANKSKFIEHVIINYFIKQVLQNKLIHLFSIAPF